MEIDKLLEPLGQEIIAELKVNLPGNNLSEWLFRVRPTLEGRCPYDFLANPTPKKVEQVKKVIKCILDMKKE